MSVNEAKSPIQVIERMMKLLDVLSYYHEPASLKQLAQLWRTAFPDLKVTVHDILAEGDLVVWCDADVRDFTPAFVTGPMAPPRMKGTITAA